MAVPQEFAAGWHPDPHGTGGLRWWDGTTWTHHTAPAPGLVASRPTPALRDAVWDLLWNPRMWPSWIPWMGLAERAGDDGRCWRLGGQIGTYAFTAVVRQEVTLRREVRLRVLELEVAGAPRAAGWEARITIHDREGGLEVELATGATAPEAPAAAEVLLESLVLAAERRKRFVSAVLQSPKRLRREGPTPDGASAVTLAFRAGWGRRR